MGGVKWMAGQRALFSKGDRAVREGYCSVSLLIHSVRIHTLAKLVVAASAGRRKRRCANDVQPKGRRCRSRWARALQLALSTKCRRRGGIVMCLGWALSAVPPMPAERWGPLGRILNLKAISLQQYGQCEAGAMRKPRKAAVRPDAACKRRHGGGNKWL